MFILVPKPISMPWNINLSYIRHAAMDSYDTKERLGFLYISGRQTRQTVADEDGETQSTPLPSP